MARIIVTAVTALGMLFVGIQALSFRDQTVSGLGLSGANQEAYNMTHVVAQDTFAIAGNAMPRLFVVILLVLLAGLLALMR